VTAPITRVDLEDAGIPTDAARTVAGPDGVVRWRVTDATGAYRAWVTTAPVGDGGWQYVLELNDGDGGWFAETTGLGGRWVALCHVARWVGPDPSAAVS